MKEDSWEQRSMEVLLRETTAQNGAVDGYSASTCKCTAAVTPEGHRSKVGRLAPPILHVGTGWKLYGQLHSPATSPQDNTFQYTLNRGLSGSRPGLDITYNNVQSFNIQGPVHRKYIPFDIFPTRCNITQFIYFWKTALHVSGGISTHHQEHTQLYLQYLLFVNRYCYLPLLWESWSWPECAHTTLRPTPTLPQ